jgi:Tfp pilus assembly protein PilF
MADVTLRTFEILLAELRGLPGEDAAGGAWDDPLDLARVRDEYTFLGDGAQISHEGDILQVSVPEPDEHLRTKAQKDTAKAGDAARRGDYGRAITLFAKALAADPSRLETRRDLAMAYFEKGDHQKARQLLREILLLAPRDHWTHVVLANSYMKHDRDLGRAERHFLQALRAAPTDAWALNGLGVLFLEKGAALDALDSFSRAVDAVPAFANAHLGRSRALEMLSRHNEAAIALERLFTEADRQDARAVPVLTQARSAYLRLEKRLAEEGQEVGHAAALLFKESLEKEGSAAIRIEESPLPAGIAGTMQMAWKHGRDYHLLKLRAPDGTSTIPPYPTDHVIAHELHHLSLELGARTVGRNKFFTTNERTMDRARTALRNDAERLRRQGFQEDKIAKTIDELVKGACGLLFNTPIDMLIERRISRDNPALRHAQFCSQHVLAAEALASTMNREARQISPRRILAVNDALNGTFALFLDDLFAGSTSYFTPFARLESARIARDLYDLWKIRMDNPAPGDEFALVDDFASILDISGWYQWIDDPCTWTVHQCSAVMNEGTTNPALLRDKASSSVMYLVDALQRYRELPLERIRAIAFEIAVLGRSGLDYASQDQKYTLNSIPGEKFTGLQLMCLMYVGFKRIDPGLDSGIALRDEYQEALALFKRA